MQVKDKTIYHLPFSISHLPFRKTLTVNSKTQATRPLKMRNEKWKMVNGKSFILSSFRPHPSVFVDYSAIFHLDDAIRKAGGQLPIMRDHQYRQRVARSHASQQLQ
jgi:hypothetical protein